MSNYGRSTSRIIWSFILLAGFFAIVYYILGIIDLKHSIFAEPHNPGIISNLFVLENKPLDLKIVLLRAFYFSIVTMTTLGFGDIYANPGNWVGYIALIFHVILGYVLLGALVTRFAFLFSVGGPIDTKGKKITFKKGKSYRKNKSKQDMSKTDIKGSSPSTGKGEEKRKHRHWDAIVALIISLSVLGYTIYHDRELNELSFQNAGIQNRPILKIVGHPLIKSIRGTSEAPITTKNINERNLGLTLSLGIEVKLINDGDSIAKIMFEAASDKYTGTPEIQKYVLDPDRRKNIKFDLINHFYKVVEINPHKERDFFLPITITNPNREGMFTIHYLFIYSNEIGNVYDSYFWARYKTKPVKTLVTEKTDKIIKLTVIANELMKSIELVDVNYSTKMYSKEESRNLFNLLRKLNKDTEQ